MVLAVLLVLFLTLVVPLGYVFLIGCARGAYLSFRALLAERKVRRAGGPEFLSDRELSEACRRIDARLSFLPLYRNPRWVARYAHLKERLDLYALSREAARLSP